MVAIHNDPEWLTELLSQNSFINIGDGLGTFLHKTTKGWKVCGRDDVIELLIQQKNTRTFNDLSFALCVAKSLKRRFLRKKDKTNERT